MLERAAMAMQGGNFTEAERLAGEVLKASRTDSAATSILCHALIAQNRGAEAIPLLEKAVQRSEDPALEILLGAALGGAGRRDEAIDHLRRTVARRPPFAPAFQELAGQLAHAGKFDDAIAVIQDAVRTIPSHIDLQVDLSRLLLRRNDRPAARDVLLKARDAAPGRPDILIALARVLLLEGEYVEAADTFRHALARQPEDAMTRADLAACLLEMNQRDAAEANLRTATRGRPQMFGRAIYAMAMSSHGRLFFRPSAAAKFLDNKPT